MPKLIDYPRASFSRSLELATTVNALGGECSYKDCADKMGIKVTGGFTAIIGAASKHNLVQAKKERLNTTTLFNNINSALSVLNKRNYLRKSFLNPPLYNNVFLFYQDKPFPTNNLSEVFINDFDVDDKLAIRISGYYIEGLKLCELLEKDRLLPLEDFELEATSEIIERKMEAPKVLEEPQKVKEPKEAKRNKVEQPLLFNENKIEEVVKGEQLKDPYQVHITGTGLDFKIVLQESDDVIIVDAILNKFKNKFK